MSHGRDQQPHLTYDGQGFGFVRHICSQFQTG